MSFTQQYQEMGCVCDFDVPCKSHPERWVPDVHEPAIGRREYATSTRKVGGKAFPDGFNWTCDVCGRECRSFEETCGYCEHEARSLTPA